MFLEDGTVFRGRLIGVPGYSVGEAVFNTAMTGYQEILTDPSYARQIITLTYPHVGNTGANSEDMESSRIYASGLIIRDLPHTSSSWRSRCSLEDFLTDHRLVAAAGMDTRRLTRHLRQHGAKNAVLFSDDVDEDEAKHALADFNGLKGLDLAAEVSCEHSYSWVHDIWRLKPCRMRPQAEFFVVAYDFGIKSNILRHLTHAGCKVQVVPAKTPAETVLKLNPDGVFLSNGPGDPEPCVYAIEAIARLIDAEMPLFGICLGHQLLGLACGARTVKMKFGHHGANHPVVDLASGQVMITSQNHGFCIDDADLPAFLETTHRSLFDGTVQGVAHRDKPVFGFQGHPEASPGPHDVHVLFKHFTDLMRDYA